MVKRKKLTIAVIVVFVLALCAVWYFLYSDVPLEDLQLSQIEQISVYAIPPDQTIVLNADDEERVIPLLQNLKVSKPGYKLFMLGMGGQTVTFAIEKTDGSTVEISNVGNVFITIDGKSYQADYPTAEALNAFANEVLGTGF